MERFKLYVATSIAQQVHHQLQVVRATNVFGHDVVVRAIKQNFAE